MKQQAQTVTLEPFKPRATLEWDEYLAPSEDHLEELKQLASSVDRAELARAMEQCMGSLAQTRPPQVPIALFYGPPGTGKPTPCKSLQKRPV